MKRFLLSLMVLVMFTPGLACAKFMKHQNSSATHMAKHMPCCPKKKMPDCGGVMFFKDCMKVDLQQSIDTLFVKKADILKKDFPFTVAQFQESVFFPINHSVRGPPSDRQVAFSRVQPIYLATLRLRI